MDSRLTFLLTPTNTTIYMFLLSGEQVLERLKFNGSVRSNLFGLGIVLIGFTFTAYIALLFSGIAYMPLGHVGRGQRSRARDEIPLRSDSADNTRPVGDGLDVTKEA